MTDMAENRVKEAPQTFKAAGEVAPLVPATGVYRARIFKSGNSLALRLPKALGLQEGLEMELELTPSGAYALRRADAPKRKIDGSKWMGKCPDLEELPRYDFEDSPRDWHLLDRNWRPA